jgi:NitT/TauT family transport system permease protein
LTVKPTRRNAWKNAFLPNRPIDRTMFLAFGGVWAVLFLLLWQLSSSPTLPRPAEVWTALGALWWTRGMGPELFTTLGLIVEATAYTVVIAMALAYLTVIPVFRPLVEAISKLRFLGITGLVVAFTLWTGGGHPFKVLLLTFGMTTFFVTAMAQVVTEIPREAFDHMRVLGASEARSVWDVVVRGTLDKALDVLRQNLAISWTMITAVEGYSRSEGGLGAMILDQNKYFKLAEVYAILFVILIVGLLLDYLLGALTRVLCPYAVLERARR